MSIKAPYLLFIGDVPDELAAKTARGVVDWRPEHAVGQMRLPGCGADLGIEDLTIGEALKRGCRSFVVGAVNSGGVLPENWIASIVSAIESGLDIVSGMHVRLSHIPQIEKAASTHGVTLHDLRFSDVKFSTGTGTKRAGKRLLCVGTDCSVGKKYSALCLERDMKKAGMDARFCATGQTGKLIADRGVALDAVVADFIAGAAEWLSPETQDNIWQVIEGQGSLFHPSFAGVTLGLLHGSQPDAFIVCHEPTRTNMRNVQHKLPSIDQVINATLDLGRLNNPDIQCVGLCVNTSKLSEEEAKTYLIELGAQYELPAVDPMRYDAMPVVEEIARRFG